MVKLPCLIVKVRETQISKRIAVIFTMTKFEIEKVVKEQYTY